MDPVPDVVVPVAPWGAVPPAPEVVVPGFVAPGVVVPGVVVPGVVVPGVVVPGVVVPGVVVPGVVAPGVVVPGVVPVPAAAGAVIVRVTGGGAGPEPRASLTSAAASTPRSSAAMTIAAATGAFQLGVADRRVCAAAPQCRHQSWSVCRFEPHSGQASAGAAPAGPTELAVENEGSAPAGVDAAAGWADRLTAG